MFIEPLKDLARQKFQGLPERDWDSDVFPDAVREVYNVAPPGSHGEQLRAIVVNIAAKCGKTLLDKGKKFCAMMEEVAEFGKHAYQVMAGGTVTLSPLAASEMAVLRCPICQFEFFANV